MNKQLKQHLRSALNPSYIQADPSHLEQTLLRTRQELYRKSSRKRIGFSAFLMMQIRFTGWRIWLAQGALAILLCSILSASFEQMHVYEIRYIFKYLCVTALLAVLTAVPFICRPLHYKMNEIEAAAFFSSARLLTAKLMIVGTGDVFMLGVVLFLTIQKTQLNAGSVFLYLAFPFLAAVSMLLYLIGHLPAKSFSSYFLGSCMLLFSGMLLLSRACPNVFQQSFSIFWTAVCTVLLIFCTSQFRYIIHHYDYAGPRYRAIAEESIYETVS